MNRINAVYFLFVIAGFQMNAQLSKEKPQTPNFFSVREEKLKELPQGTNQNDDEMAKFKRWEHRWEARTWPTGNFPPQLHLYNELKKYNENYSNAAARSTSTPNWTPIEPQSGYPLNGQSGRINCIAFHPTDTNTFYVGTPAGGLWKTTNGGLNWTPKTDNLPSLGVSEVLIDPTNPNIMYMASGDRDAANYYGDPYSYGVLKSIDAGNTWTVTSLTHLIGDQATVQRMLIHPTQPNIILASVSAVNGAVRGIWRSVDAGATWTNTYGGAKYDMEFNPANPNIVYASAYSYLIRSTDAGATWSTMTSTVFPVGMIYTKLAVTPAKPNIVYAQIANNSGNVLGLYKSSDAGLTWTQKNTYTFTTQGNYDWVMAVSHVDSNFVMYGGQFMYKSTDGGTTTFGSTQGYFDNHSLDFRPGTKCLFDCCDGGLYKTYNNGNTWINLNSGLQTFQYYRIGTSKTKPSMILSGAQDNGTNKHYVPNWTKINGGDGMECLVDYTDSTIYYAASQYGVISRFGTGLGTFTNPPPAGGNQCYWITPYVINTSTPQILYYGAKEIYKTVNRGNSWTAISSSLTIADNVGGGMIRSMAVAESKPDSVLYGASLVVVYRTVDAGNTWQNITSNLPVSAGCFTCSAITSIMVHPNNHNIVWVTMSGYNSTKIFKTTNGGVSWTDISGTLPAIPFNHIVFEKNNHETLYAASDLGVFSRDTLTNTWQPYMTGLPNVPVEELEINYTSGKLIAATFGRGLWESTLFVVTTGTNEKKMDKGIKVYPNPNQGIFNVQCATGKAVRAEVYNLIGEKVYCEDLSYGKGMLDLSQKAKGVYLLRLLNGNEIIYSEKLVIN